MTTVTEPSIHTAPALETGWGATTPVDDTVQRHGLLAMPAAWEAIARACGGRTHRADGWEAIDLGRPTGLFNSATVTHPLRDEELGPSAARIERFYDRGGHGAALLWSPWPTPDLTARGWTLQGHPPLLYRPAGLPIERREPAHLEIVEVSTARELTEWCRTAVEAFPLTEVDRPGSLLEPTVLDDDRFRFLLGRAEGRSVAVGCQAVVRGANVLLLSTVHPGHRGRGAYGALVAERLARHPDLPSVTIVSDDSRPILVTRFGFLPISRWTLWERPRPCAPTPSTDRRPTTPDPATAAGRR